ncbi:MAG: DEAD/DEAH box helicase, partial [Acidobacteriota bacterium]
MSLNPVHFGAEVIDQFGRYLMTTFPIADHDMETQVREHLRHDIGGERLIAKGPYVYLNRPFEEGPTVDELCAEKTLGLHPALRGVFRFETVHKHQELALRAIKAGKHTVVATGTGSGKTEAFLMPVVDHCLHLRDQQAAAGVVAVVVYPMNALADDQLRRLRPMLAGTGVTFGRYTGVTPETDEPEQGRLSTSRAYTESELATLAEGKEEKVPIPWEECFHRSEIRKRRPRIILTNYSQLEYLLLRDTDLHLFRDAPLRFLIFDEVHTYTGAVGSEVACLIRRLRHVARKGPGDVICVGTSATVQEADDSLDGAEATRDFAWRLFGVQRDEVELVTEHYRAKAQVPDELLYLPPFPKKPRELLEKVLDKARKLQLQDEVRELTGDLLGLVETLCGRKAPDGPTRMDRAFSLLSTSRVVSVLGEQFKSPALLATALARVRALGRDKATDEDLIAEMLCYLTLGALVQRELEPVLRPKLHYFMQGFQGLGCSIEPDGRPVIHFDVDTATGEDEGKILPMALCRSCGQHYFKVVASQPVLEGGVGVSRIRLLDADSPVDEQSEKLVYLTTSLVGLDEGEDATGKPPPETFMCRVCGALHDAHSPECLVHKCGRSGTLVKMLRFNGQMKTCLACGTAAKGYEEIVTPAKSSEVADITILAQSMLTAMPEEPLQKLLVFSDNRQDAAFQAGWMEERSRRFRLRHILYSTLEGEPSRVWSLDRLTEHMVDRAKQLGVLRSAVWDDDDNYTRVRWFLLEEFASTGQRRSSLETLALVEVLTHGIEVADAPNFYATWSKKLGVDPTELSRLVRLILDYYRRHGIVSDELLKRRWTDRDMQVRKGLVSTFDQYRPQALVFAKDTPSSFAKALVARNGRSGAQEILRKGIPDGTRLSSGTRDEFLQDLWDWLTSEKGDGSQARDAEVLVSTTLLQKFGGKQQPIDVPGSPHQIRHQKLGFRLTSTRWLCPACRRAQSVPPPSGACPEYGCKGTLVETGRDEEHFDVHQYTRKRFVPLKTWEHSAQVPKAERQKIEREFKKETGGRYNCLVCTPTLELGVDIGKLEMALM